ncbi:hypothetical protein GQ53DRAFT_294591 [Thozetella sp. PMI_491]|nr:hypothetical protein GQ53DRAFT_294591 [Thozetella sp. PMI_491]
MPSQALIGDPLPGPYVGPKELRNPLVSATAGPRFVAVVQRSTRGHPPSTRRRTERRHPRLFRRGSTRPQKLGYPQAICAPANLLPATATCCPAHAHPCRNPVSSRIPQRRRRHDLLSDGSHPYGPAIACACPFVFLPPERPRTRALRLTY